MTLNEILGDIRSDRVKKVIMDCDAYNDIDDQYAIAFALGSDRMEVLGVNAVLFNNYRCNGFADGMQRSYDEIVKVLKFLKKEHIPAFLGCDTPLTQLEEGEWVDCPAVQNIIKLAHESDEMIYIIATGAATNVSSAIIADPTIKDNICVIWVGCNCIDFDGPAGDFNVGQDHYAGRFLLNCGVNLILLPAMGPEGCGTQTLIGNPENIVQIKGDSATAKFFREDLPELAYPGQKEWTHHLWDIAGPGLLHCPEAYDVEIMMAPRMRGDDVWSFDQGRHDIVYMHKLDPDKVTYDFFEAINALIAE